MFCFCIITYPIIRSFANMKNSRLDEVQDMGFRPGAVNTGCKTVMHSTLMIGFSYVLASVICAIFGSDRSLSPVQCHMIASSNSDLIRIATSGKYLSAIWIAQDKTYPFKNIYRYFHLQSVCHFAQVSSCPHGPFTRYVKLRTAHAPGMPGIFSQTPRVSDPDMHHGTCVTYLTWCMPESLTSGFLWSRWREKNIGACETRTFT